MIASSTVRINYLLWKKSTASLTFNSLFKKACWISRKAKTWNTNFIIIQAFHFSSLALSAICCLFELCTRQEKCIPRQIFFWRAWLLAISSPFCSGRSTSLNLPNSFAICCSYWNYFTGIFYHSYSASNRKIQRYIDAIQSRFVVNSRQNQVHHLFHLVLKPCNLFPRIFS